MNSDLTVPISFACTFETCNISITGLDKDKYGKGRFKDQCIIKF